MALNLKEIFEGDSDIIKVSKLNYNFDQLLANGGGPQGPQGTQGVTGIVGPIGPVGAQGIQGVAGNDGSNGVSLNVWDSDIEYDEGGLTYNSSYNIIRPFNKNDDGTTDLKTRVILGDENAFNLTGNKPSFEPLALLNIIIPQDPSSNTEVSNHINILHSAAGSADYAIRSEHTGTTTTFKITGTVGSGSANFALDIPNNITISSAETNLTATTGDITVTGNSNLFANINDDIQIKSLSSGDITIGDSTTTNNITILGSNDIDLSCGADFTMTSDTLTINTTGNNSISGYNNTLSTSATGQGNLLTSLGLAGFNRMSVSQTNAVNEMLAAGSSSKNKMTATGINATNEITSNTSNTLDAVASNSFKISGVDKLKVEDIIITSSESIYFDDPNGVHKSTGGALSAGDGLRWKDGGAQEVIGTQTGYSAAPNYNRPVDDRTLTDYFWEKGIVRNSYTDVGCGFMEANGAVIADDNSAPNTNPSFPGANPGDFSNYGIVRPINNVSTHGQRSRYGYVKIGNLLQVWGEGEIGIGGGAAADFEGNTNPVVISMNKTQDTGEPEAFVFPYTNDAGTFIDVDITITSNDFTDEVADAAQNLHGNTIGRIYPGDNNIYLFNEGPSAPAGTLNGAATAQYDIKPLLVEELMNDPSGDAIRIFYSFKFSMPTETNAYNKSYYTASNNNLMM